MPINIVGKVRALLEWADELILGDWMELLSPPKLDKS